MRNFILYIGIMACFISCKTTQAYQIEEGEFTKPYDYIFVNSRRFGEQVLVLHKDGTFSLELDGAVVTVKCHGRWYYSDHKTIHLKCDEPIIPKDTCRKDHSLSPFSYLWSNEPIIPGDTCRKVYRPSFPYDPTMIKGYMQVRERNVKVVNENKIRLELPESKRRKYIVLKRCMSCAEKPTDEDLYP